MSNRRRTGDSSLELLLDTITNTFGGILFLAILVSLLLRTASPTPGRQGDPTPRFTASEQQSLELKLDDLKDQFARFKRRPAAAPPSDPDPEITRSREEAERLSARFADALTARATLAMETATHQRERTAAIEEASQLESRRAASAERLSATKSANEAALVESQRLAQLKLTLERSVRPTTIDQTVGMPTLRDSRKDQVCIYVRFGKIFMMHSYRGGVRVGPNPQFFVVAPGNPPVARPKPGAGVEINPDTVMQELDRLLSSFPPARWVVAVVVFHNSFADFQIVKQAIVEAGYEYRPLPVYPGGSIMDSGGQSEAQ